MKNIKHLYRLGPLGKMNSFFSKVILIWGVCLAVHGAVLFRDDFNDGTIDPTKWEVRILFPDAVVIESGGALNFRNGGLALSRAGFEPPYELNARVSLSGNPYGMLVIRIRTSGTMAKPSDSPNELADGIRFQIAKSEDGGGGNSFYVHDGSGEIMNTVRSFSPGQYYDIKIIDDGSRFEFFFEDMESPLLAGTSAESSGQRISFQNRPGAG